MRYERPDPKETSGSSPWTEAGGHVVRIDPRPSPCCCSSCWVAQGNREQEEEVVAGPLVTPPPKVREHVGQGSVPTNYVDLRHILVATTATTTTYCPPDDVEEAVNSREQRVVPSEAGRAAAAGLTPQCLPACRARPSGSTTTRSCVGSGAWRGRGGAFQTTSPPHPRLPAPCPWDPGG